MRVLHVLRCFDCACSRIGPSDGWTRCTHPSLAAPRRDNGKMAPPEWCRCGAKISC